MRKEYFDWYASENMPVFPIDLSQREAGALWKKDKRGVKRFIEDNPIFSSFYKWMRINSEASVNSGRDRIKGIPAELQSFFATFLEVAQTAPERKDILHGNVSTEFEEKLCCRLYELSMRMGKEEVGAVDGNWDHMLYENATFRRIVSDKLWNEVETRFRKFKNIATMQSDEMQVKLLKNMVLYMDMQLGMLITEGEKIERANNQESFLSTFPIQFLSKVRHKVRLDGSGKTKRSAMYRVKNININDSEYPEIKTINQAFDKIRKSGAGTKKLRETTRNAYIEEINKMYQKTRFQELCVDFQQYMDAFAVNKSDEEIKKDIQERCKVYYASIVQGRPLFAEIQYDDTPVLKSEGNDFVGVMIYRLYIHFTQRFHWAIEYMREGGVFTHIVRFALAKSNGLHEETEADNYVRWYTSAIKQVWDGEKLGNSSVVDTIVSTQDAERLSDVISEICVEMFHEFGLLIPGWAQRESIYNDWGHYNSLIYRKNDINDILGFTIHGVNILRTLVCCAVWREYQRTCDAVYDCYKAVLEII